MQMRTLLRSFSCSLAGDSAEHDDVRVGIAAQTVCAVRDARHFTRSPEPRDHLAVSRQRLRFFIDAHAAHRVVHARHRLDDVVLTLTHVDETRTMVEVFVVALAGHRSDAVNRALQTVVGDLREVGNALQIRAGRHDALLGEGIVFRRVFFDSIRYCADLIVPKYPAVAARLIENGFGEHVAAAELYRTFLNEGITPVVPSRGSIGDADITLASHVGATMMGEWKVTVNGKVISSADALKAKGITPLVPQGKDGLGILSTNSVGVAMLMNAMQTMRQAVKVTPTVFGLTLEGLNGNVAPFLAQTVNSHPLLGLQEAAKNFREELKGSYLWTFDKTRNLQDPLSFRTTVYTYSEALRALTELDALVNIQINSSDDNPGVILNASKEDYDSTQVAQYFVDAEGLKGAIIPSANFEPLPIAISAERAAIALAHVAHNCVQRTIRLDEDRFSGLPRYLTAESNKNGHNFGATEDSMVSIYAENVDLANPVSMDGSPVEGNIEDTASNLPRIAERLNRSADNIIDLYSMELLHSTQAIDLRRAQQDNVKLSPKTEALYKAYRAKVPFVDKDRIFSGDLEEGISILKNWR